VARVTRQPLGRRGFAEAGLIAEWAAVVGPVLARHTCPSRIAYRKGTRGDGTLHVRVASGAMAMELQHLEPIVLERVNAYFGWRAVAKLAIAQGPLPERKAKRPPPPTPAEAVPPAMSERLALVEDEELRAKLEALARFIGR